MPKSRKEGLPMAGRKPKPTAMKELEGNPGKRKLNKKEPIPAKGMHICPEWLMPEAMNDVVYERLIDLCTDICKIVQNCQRIQKTQGKSTFLGSFLFVKI